MNIVNQELKTLTLSGLSLVLTLAVALAPSGATEYSYHDGYYWSGNQAYTRTQYYQPGYYRCGYYYPGYYYYSYSYDHDYYPPRQDYAPKAPEYGPNWKAEAIKYAKERDDYATFLQTLKALGVQGQQYPFQQGTYGYSYYNYSPGYATGATQYGYSYKQVTDSFGSLDLTASLAGANRLVQNAQEVSKGMFTDLNGTINNLGERQASVSRIIAEGEARARQVEAAVKILEASKLQPSLTTETTVQSATAQGRSDQGSATGSTSEGTGAIGTGGGGANGASSATGTISDSAFLSLRQLRCGSCHGAKEPKGNLSLLQPLSSYNDHQRAAILERIFTTDLAKHMPRTAEGKPADLPVQEKVEFTRRFAP